MFDVVARQPWHSPRKIILLPLALVTSFLETPHFANAESNNEGVVVLRVEDNTSASEVVKRRQLAPLIRNLTNCLSNKSEEDPEAVLALKANNFRAYLKHEFHVCLEQVDRLVGMFDYLYGEGKGIEFLNGAYSSDVPRAVLSRVGHNINQKLKALNEQDAAWHDVMNSPATATPNPTPSPDQGGSPPKEATLIITPNSPPQEPPKEASTGTPAIKPDLTAGREFLTSAEVPRVVETYKANEMRFSRDYKARQFKDTVMFYNAKQNLFIKGSYIVSYNSGTISCVVDDKPTIDIVADWNKGDDISLVGDIDDVTFDVVQLSHCYMKKQ